MLNCWSDSPAGVSLSSPVEQETDMFEETYAELRKWADVNSPKYLLLTVKREKRAGRLGSALKVRICETLELELFFPEILTLNAYLICATYCPLLVSSP